MAHRNGTRYPDEFKQHIVKEGRSKFKTYIDSQDAYQAIFEYIES